MRITDPQALRAMSHPLRLDLIELLGTRGPATAAECARQLGTSQASCSFHLRQLAKYGFVEQAPGSADRRERPWQMTDFNQSWSSADSGAVGVQLEHVFIDREANRLHQWADRRLSEPEAWQRATFLGGATLMLSADEVRAVGEGMNALLEPYIARLTEHDSRPSDGRFVRIFLGAAPVAHLDGPNDSTPSGTASPESTPE